MSEKSKTKEILEWVYCILIAVVIVIIIKSFIGVPTVVKQGSMYPTIKQNERLWLNRLGTTTDKMPERSKIITFEAPTQSYIDSNHYDPNNPVAIYEYKPDSLILKFSYYILEIGKTSYIKRVIGIPGDHVQIKDGAVYLNGEKLEEEYLPDGLKTESCGGVFTDVVVPENTVYVLGDNRSGSKDSRFFGCIPVDRIEGIAVFRFWPLNNWSKLK